MLLMFRVVNDCWIYRIRSTYISYVNKVNTFRRIRTLFADSASKSPSEWLNGWMVVISNIAYVVLLTQCCSMLHSAIKVNVYSHFHLQKLPLYRYSYDQLNQMHYACIYRLLSFITDFNFFLKRDVVNKPAIMSLTQIKLTFSGPMHFA